MHCCFLYAYSFAVFFCFFFFFNDTATTEIYTLSLHDALPISEPARVVVTSGYIQALGLVCRALAERGVRRRSEEHTSELQSLTNLVCRLLLEKKKKNKSPQYLDPNKKYRTR